MDDQGLPGDREQFEALFRTECTGLVRELRLILGDPGGAEEVAAEAFVEVWRRWSDVRGYDRPAAWVRRVALHLADDVLLVTDDLLLVATRDGAVTAYDL